jgi:hypothetical protein
MAGGVPSRRLAQPVRRVASPTGARQAFRKRRRKQILQMLVGSCVLTLLLTIGVRTGALLFAHLGTDAVLFAYVAMLRRVKQAGRAERGRATRSAVREPASHRALLVDSESDSGPFDATAYAAAYDVNGYRANGYPAAYNANGYGANGYGANGYGADLYDDEDDSYLSHFAESSYRRAVNE